MLWYEQQVRTRQNRVRRRPRAVRCWRRVAHGLAREGARTRTCEPYAILSHLILAGEGARTRTCEQYAILSYLILAAEGARTRTCERT